jgi:TIR domain/SIR2-like domain
MNEAAWKRLLRQIRDGYVVPVVGPQLLVAPDGTTLQGRIAGRLLDAHGEAFDAAAATRFRELHDVITQLKAGVSLQDLYCDINDAIAEVGAEAGLLPEPIRQLAAITDFRLFVTLNPDDLLAGALRKRCAVNETVHAPRSGSENWRDLPTDWATRHGEVQLLYLFGKASSLPTFAIHDEDVLEFSHNLIAGGSQVPQRFIDELRRKGLLMLGCSFPDWLTRFFLRLTASDRLAKKDTRTWLVNDPGPDESLVRFLDEFAHDTEVLSGTSPAQFVDELHRRWQRAQATATGAVSAHEAPAPVRGTLFFVSYSRRTDLQRAEALVADLRSLGVAENEIWFDRDVLEPGEDYRQRILDGIQVCRHFVPLLSEAGHGREEAFVFSEWRAANRRRQNMNRQHFVIPTVVDSEYQPERYRSDAVREWAQDHIDFGFAPEGVPDERTRTLLTRLVRESRRESRD